MNTVYVSSHKLAIYTWENLSGFHCMSFQKSNIHNHLLFSMISTSRWNQERFKKIIQTFETYTKCNFFIFGLGKTSLWIMEFENRLYYEFFMKECFIVSGHYASKMKVTKQCKAWGAYCNCQNRKFVPLHLQVNSIINANELNIKFI